MTASLKRPGAQALRDRAPLVFFLFFYFLLALSTYRDFGVSWDEYDAYSIGGALARYLSQPAAFPWAFLHSGVPVDRWLYYDYLYPMALNLLNPSFSVDYFHWLNFFFASAAFILSYEMLLASTRKPWWSLLGPVFLLLTPQFSGQVPFNPRDVPFAVLYFASLAALHHFGTRGPTLWKPLVLGLLFGAAQSVRLAGLTLYPLLILFSLYLFLMGKGPKRARQWAAWAGGMAVELALVFSVAGLVLAAFWPYLGSDFFRHLLDLARSSAHYPWNGANSLVDPAGDRFLFRGRMVQSSALPWTYVPVWIGVSTPLFILALAAASGSWIKAPVRNPLFVLLAGVFLADVGLFILVRPTLYLGLRHYLFVLPPLATLAALSAAEGLAARPWDRVRGAVAGLVLLNGLFTAYHMVRLHPYEYVYFNELEGGLPGAYGRYEIEYMGTSAKEAVEWLAANGATDPRRLYLVRTLQDPFQVLPYLPPNFRLAQGKEPGDFLISLPYSGRHRFKDPLLHSVTREGVPLMDIYGRSEPLK